MIRLFLAGTGFKNRQSFFKSVHYGSSQFRTSLRSFCVIAVGLALDLAVENIYLRLPWVPQNKEASSLSPIKEEYHTQTHTHTHKELNTAVGLSNCEGSVLLFHTPLNKIQELIFLPAFFWISRRISYVHLTFS
jgi:hypothetical protein